MLRRGNGDGTFQPEVPTGILPFNSALSRFDRLADLTGDGVLDYVMFTPDGLFPVTISQGLGDGTFGSPAGYRGPGGNAAIADLNHDGRLDIVVPGDTFDVMFARCVR
jgi:hypothetical protein